MNHWYTADGLGAAHRADLNREAGRTSLAALAKRTGPTSRGTWASIVAGLLQGRRTRLGSAGADQRIPDVQEIQVEVA